MTSTIDLRKLPPQTADFSQIWPFLKAGVLGLMEFPEIRISATEYVNLSVAVHQVAKTSRACALDIQQNLMEVFNERVQSTAKEAAKMDEVDLLRYYVTEFHEYKTVLERVNRLFAYFNRWWARKAEGAKLLPVDSLGLIQWKENCALVIQRDGKKITTAILQLIMKERNGEKIDEDLVKNAIHSFIALDIDRDGFYEKEFESPFLKATADYHEKELEEISQSENFILDYLNKVEEKLLDEERRAQRYLPQKTHDAVFKTLLISGHCEALGQVLLQIGDDVRLREMYTLLSRIKPDGLGLLKKIFEQHVRTESATPDDGGTSGQLGLSGIRQRHNEIVATCFQGDLNFAQVLDEVGVLFAGLTCETSLEDFEERPIATKKKKKKGMY